MHYLLLLIAWCSVVCSQTTTVTIHNQAEAKSVAAASPTIVGSVVIASTYSGPLSLDGITNITDTLSNEDFSMVTNVSSSTLQSCGLLNFKNSKTIATLIFPALILLNALSLSAVRNLTSFTMSNPYPGTQNLDMIIVDTGLTNTDSITATHFGLLQFWDNLYLTNITMARAVQVSYLNVVVNGNGTTDIRMPQLQEFTGRGVFVNGFTSIELPSLNKISSLELMGVYHAGSAFTFTLPSLRQISGGLSLYGGLSNFNAPLLQEVTQGISIQGDPPWTVLNGFPNLTTAGGISVSGYFKSIMFPSLVSVPASFIIYGSDNSTIDCTPFDKLKINNQILGDYRCIGIHNPINPTSSSTTPTQMFTTTSATASSSATPDSNGLSTGAKAGTGAGVGGTVLIGLIIGGLWLRRRRNRTRKALQTAAINHSSVYHDAVELKGIHDPVEMSVLDQHQKPVEMSALDRHQEPVELESPSYYHISKTAHN